MTISGDNLEGLFSMEGPRGGEIEDEPFRMLVIGDFRGDAAAKDLTARRPVEIDRDNFDEVLSRFSPALSLEINGAGLSLTFAELEDFHPDRIFEQVPLFSDMRDLRRRLKNESTFNEAAREVRAWGVRETGGGETEPPAPAVSGESGDLLSQILSQPGGSAPQPKRASSELDSLLSELVRPHLVTVDEDEQSQLVAAVDSATSGLMRKILHDHKFQALEATWRGLFFMVRRVETDTHLKILIMDLSKDELSDDLKNAGNLSASYIYKTLVADTVETPGAETWSAVIANYGFLPNVEDVAALVRVSKICAAANAPFVSHMRPEVLGIHSLDGHADPREWDLSGESEAGKLWSTLRSMPESGYLGMTTPRFMGRLPYGADWEPLEAFSFEEFDNPPDHNNYLWINSSFACGLLLCQSFSASGWEMGRSFVQDIDRLPLHTYEADGETVYTPCAEVQMTHDACDKLMEYGLMPLVSYKNSDHVKLARFQSITDPVTGLSGKWRRG